MKHPLSDSITSITNQQMSVSELVSVPPNPAEVEADFWRELQEIETEAMGWTPLAPGSYLHTVSVESPFIEIVGVASVNMAADNVLWLF